MTTTTSARTDRRSRSVPWTKVDEYIVTYPAGLCSPRIQLVGPLGEFGTELVFQLNGSVLPADSRARVHYHREDFAPVLDVLRNETPVYFVFNGPADANGFQTGGKVGHGGRPPAPGGEDPGRT